MESLFLMEPFDHFKSVSQDILNNLYTDNPKSTSFIEPSVIESAKLEIRELISDCNYNIDDVAATFKEKAWDEDKVDYFITCLQEKRTDLLFSLLAHNNSTYGESLINFDWVLKLVLGTSELKSLKYPLIQLALNTVDVNGKEDQRMYELNKETLSKLISVLENIQ